MSTNPTLGRAVFVDDSGDSATDLLLTAVCVDAGVLPDVREIVDGYYERILSFFGLPDDFELHGVRLERTGKEREAPDHLKPHERDFLYRHTLDFITDLPTVRIHSVYWNWAPAPYKVQGQGKGHRSRTLFQRLFAWLDEEAEPITALSIDGTGNNLAVRTLDRYRRDNEHSLILADPQLVDSKQERLVQLADMVAYASAQVAKRNVNDRVRKFREWHSQTTSTIAAPNHWRHAMRCYRGETSPVEHH